MSFNGSGSFVLNSGGLPYVTGTTISSTTANNLNSDLASGLSNVICKDGQTTVTANLPMSTFRHTNVGAASARTDYARASQVQDSTLLLIGSIAGTNTITGSLTPAITAYAAGQAYQFTPANTNTGATTININSVGARNVFWNGAACVGGELRQGIPVRIVDDGTQVNIVGNGFNAPFLDTHAIVEGSADSTKKLRVEVDGFTTATTRVATPPDRDFTIGDASVLQAEVATTSGTAVAISTTVPTWAKKITIGIVGVSTNGTSSIMIQIGPSGGLETTNYLGAGWNAADTAAPSVGQNSNGFKMMQSSAAAAVYHGIAELILQNASTNLWVFSSATGRSDLTAVQGGGGSKALAGALTRVSITTAGGTDAFDAGAVSLIYE